MSFPGFDPSFFTFLKQLKTHNDREWFAEHKDRFVEDVETPAREFVRAFQPKLKTISPRFVADPRRVGGSMFRIYRDTRFSANKAPFKTHIGLRFWHDAKGQDSVPLYYLHLEPGSVFGGAGIYHPDPAALRKIRLAIANDTKAWKKVLGSGLELRGETLQRVPNGFAADHPFAVDLKRKGHVVMAPFTAKDTQSPAFLNEFTDSCRRAVPLMKFLVSALDLTW